MTGGDRPTDLALTASETAEGVRAHLSGDLDINHGAALVSRTRS
jgi:hypothetical protein